MWNNSKEPTCESCTAKIMALGVKAGLFIEAMSQHDRGDSVLMGACYFLFINKKSMRSGPSESQFIP